MYPALKFFMILQFTISTAKGFERNSINFKSFLNKLQSERNFESVIIFGSNDHHEYCIEESILKSLKVPILFLQSTNKRPAPADPIGEEEYGTATINNEILVIYCIEDTQMFEVNHIDALLSFLDNKRSVRIVFYWSRIDSVHSHQQKLEQLFVYCKHEHLLNVISIFMDFTTTTHFYTYTQFPEFELQVKNLQEEKCFPNRLTNMNGAAIRTMPDHLQPRNIMYSDKSGQIQLIGYCGRIVRTFAAKHNATLVFPFPLNLEVSYTTFQIFELTRNKMLDIPMSMWNPVPPFTFREFSMIIEHDSVRFLLPLPPPLTVQEIFLLIFISLFSLIVVLLFFILSALLAFEHTCWHDEEDDQQHETFYSIFSHTTIAITLPGILGKSIQLPKLVSFYSTFKKCTYICLFFAGIIVSTTYTAYLQSYFTSTLYGKRIESYEELLASPIRICMHSALYEKSNYTDPREWQRYRDVAYVTNISEYRRNRHTLNPRYGYLGGNSAMSVMLKQQLRLFERQLFYSPEKIYLSRENYLAIPLHAHSIYRRALNTLILQLLESGLLDFWVGMAYEDFRIAGFLNARAKQEQDTEKRLKVSHFYYIWWMYGIGLAFGTVAFIVENIRFIKSRGLK